MSPNYPVREFCKWPCNGDIDLILVGLSSVHLYEFLAAA